MVDSKEEYWNTVPWSIADVNAGFALEYEDFRGEKRLVPFCTGNGGHSYNLHLLLYLARLHNDRIGTKKSKTEEYL